MVDSTPKEKSDGLWAFMRESADSIIRLKGGVVGRNSAVCIIALIALVGAIWFKPDVAGYVIWIILAIVLVVVLGNLWYGNKYPEIAMMEGSEILHRKRLEMATKTGPVPSVLLEPRVNPEIPLLEQTETALLPDDQQERPPLPGGNEGG